MDSIPSPVVDNPAIRAEAAKATKLNGTNPSHGPSNASLFLPDLVHIQLIILAVYPLTVLLGIISNHPPDSYFAKKANFINIFFLKFGWAWTTIAFIPHLIRLPQKAAPLGRYFVATIWWYLVTQWCFGPPIMDIVFRGTGGICQLARNEDYPDIFTSAVCRSSGGAWSGGHDLSGHIFILTHASLFLWWEILPSFSNPTFLSSLAARMNLGLLALWWSSLLNTSIYFHTILEKISGLIAGLIGWYIVEVVARALLDTVGV